MLPASDFETFATAIPLFDGLRPYQPFRKFEYYHPDQCGSSSIKQVLPALTGKDYGGLAIQDGDTASREYVRTHMMGNTSTAERDQVRRELLEYCCLDTQGMVDLVAGLGKRTC